MKFNKLTTDQTQEDQEDSFTPSNERVALSLCKHRPKRKGNSSVIHHFFYANNKNYSKICTFRI